MQLFKLLFYELSRTTLDYTFVIPLQNNIMKLFVKFSDSHSFNKYVAFLYMSITILGTVMN